MKDAESELKELVKATTRMGYKACKNGEDLEDILNEIELKICHK